jgi:AraC-like DNA-binding protein
LLQVIKLTNLCSQFISDLLVSASQRSNARSLVFACFVEKLANLLTMLTTTTPPIEANYKGLTHTRLQQVLDYIQTHLDRELSLAELAEVINVSSTYFASLFKQTMGISPHQYVIKQRVERAKVMLKKTDFAISDIALQVGFSSQSHLTQQFKRITGVTPKQIR